MTFESKMRITIGRDPACDLVVDAPGVKSFHCNVESRNGEWVVAPKQGPIGTRSKFTDQLRWTMQPTPTNGSEGLWLTPAVALPWPYEIAGSRTLTVGRAVDCDLCIDHPSVSGRHAKLVIS